MLYKHVAIASVRVRTSRRASERPTSAGTEETAIVYNFYPRVEGPACPILDR